MSAARRSMSSWPRRVFMLAAFLALALQLMFPPGFMAAAPGQAQGFPIVICSAQGQTVVDWDFVGHKSKAPAKTNAACPFAGHSVISSAPEPVVVATPVAFVHAVPQIRPYAVFPGRGLAAPPPPAIGPPLSA
jgi:hypothetical protein